MMLGKIQKIHFVGIGGIGMSGIAELLYHQGFKISGSDKTGTSITNRLKSIGIECFEGHSEKNITDPDLVVYTAAIPEDNPELKEARRRDILCVRRSEMLAECMRLQQGICIAGTHGKTSTSSMIGLMLLNGGMDPSLLIGGTLKELDGSNARFGKGEFIVAEADEYDRTFLKLNPVIGVITNIEAEHLDIYKDIDDIKAAFIEFANKVPFFGFVVICSDDDNVNQILPELKRRVVKYGIYSAADIKAEKINFNKFSSSYDLIVKGAFLANIELNVPGIHNVRNSLAAIAVGLELGVNINKISDSLKMFRGADRRFEVKYDDKIMVIDDYAHHPTEVEATIKALKGGWKRRLVTVFQPHLYSRTQEFHREFGRVFQATDVLVCLEIYPSREEPIEGVTSELITDSAKKYGHKEVFYLKDKTKITDFLMNLKRESDIIIFMGAGDIINYSELFVSELKKL